MEILLKPIKTYAWPGPQGPGRKAARPQGPGRKARLPHPGSPSNGPRPLTARSRSRIVCPWLGPYSGGTQARFPFFWVPEGSLAWFVWVHFWGLAAQTPKIDDSRPTQKPRIKNPSVLRTAKHPSVLGSCFRCLARAALIGNRFQFGFDRVSIGSNRILNLLKPYRNLIKPYENFIKPY